LELKPLRNIGLEEVGYTDKDKILVKVLQHKHTRVLRHRVLHRQSLAHVASAEGINCVEKIAGIHVDPIDYGNVPGCTYASPEIASVGLTEKQEKKDTN
jgi:dihydrolipoamide dehydrogenase